MIVGVDATRSRSGGAISHLRNLFNAVNPICYGIERVHLWAHDRLLEQINPEPWLTKHTTICTRKTLLHQVVWQYYKLPRIARNLGITVMFNTDAATVCPFQPSVTLNQDLLSFEPGEITRYSWLSKDRLRLEVIRILQIRSLSRSTITIFLSEYAARLLIANGSFRDVVISPHGIDPIFLNLGNERREWPAHHPIRCLYISNAALYKHQWHVITAIKKMRDTLKLDLRLRLVGGGRGEAYNRLVASLDRHDPAKEFVELLDFIPASGIVEELIQADLFIFASSCEAFGITLLEAMASGLPIACSNRSSLPELIGNGAVYFDPESPDSISAAVFAIIKDPATRQFITTNAQQRAMKFTWKQSADLTWKSVVKAGIERDNFKND